MLMVRAVLDGAQAACVETSRRSARALAWAEARAYSTMLTPTQLTRALKETSFALRLVTVSLAIMGVRVL